MAKSYMSPDEVEKKALDFLNQYHPKNTLPVPIEEIIEFDLEIDIVPTPDMMTTSGVDAVTSHDLTKINIDKTQYEKTPNRARFTLAHEVGHIVLHKDFIDSKKFKDEKEWRQFVLKDLHRDPLEVQANMFAVFLLIPTSHLAKEFEDEKQKLKEHPAYKAFKGNLPDDKTLAPYVARPLAIKFEVSEETMINRLNKWLQVKTK